MQRTMYLSVLPATAMVVTVLAAGCVSSVEPRSAHTIGLGLGAGGRSGPSPTESHDDEVACVMEVPGTGIHMHDIDGGLAVTFDTVTPDAVGMLRHAVRHLRDVYSGKRDEHHLSHHSARAQALARAVRSRVGALPAFAASVRDVDRGAQLEIRASDPAEAATLRERLRTEVGAMQRGVCPIFDGHH